MARLSLVLPGGGMKLSYQTGRVGALLDAGLVPSEIVAVSSGIVSALMFKAAIQEGMTGEELCRRYAGHLDAMASKGRLPSMSAVRRYGAEQCSAMIRHASAEPPLLRALAARRDDYRPLVVDLVGDRDPDFFEALVSLPRVFDNRASRRLGLIDGGYHSNHPHESVAGPAIVMAFFPPRQSPFRRYEDFVARSPIRARPVTHALRLLWAIVNTTFPPRPRDPHQVRWEAPLTDSGLTFFSRDVQTHRRAIRRGQADGTREPGRWPAVRRLSPSASENGSIGA